MGLVGKKGAGGEIRLGGRVSGAGSYTTHCVFIDMKHGKNIRPRSAMLCFWLYSSQYLRLFSKDL